MWQITMLARLSTARGCIQTDQMTSAALTYPFIHGCLLKEVVDKFLKSSKSDPLQHLNETRFSLRVNSAIPQNYNTGMMEVLLGCFSVFSRKKHKYWRKIEGARFINFCYVSCKMIQVAEKKGFDSACREY
jgi:hypothetical protein